MKKVFTRKELLKYGMYSIRLNLEIAKKNIVIGREDRARRFLNRSFVEASFLSDLGLFPYKKEELLKDIIIRIYNNF